MVFIQLCGLKSLGKQVLSGRDHVRALSGLQKGTRSEPHLSSKVSASKS